MKNKILIYLAVFIILLLCAGVLALVSSSPSNRQEQPMYKGSSSAVTDPASPAHFQRTLADLKDQELLGLPSPQSLPPAGPGGITASGRAPLLEAGLPAGGKESFSPVSAYAPARGPKQETRLKGRLPGGSASASTAGKGGASSAMEVSSGGAVQGVADLRDSDSYKKANETLLSYLAPKDRQKQEALMREMDTLSNNLSNALARAMAPKSKRQAMVEKYTRRSGPEALKGNNNPFADVVSQIASQKSSVVQSMTDNFGAAAGQQAGKIMDSFQKEASAVANRTDLTQQQKGDEIRKLNNKYQRQLNELTRAGSLQKMEAEQRQENEDYLALLRSNFNPETESAAREILDNFTTQKMQLIQQGLPAADFQEKYLKLKQEADDKVKEAVFKANPTRMDTAEVLENINRQTAKAQMERDKAAVEAGLKQDQTVYVSEDVKQKYRDNFAAQRAKDVKAVAQAYGPEVAAQFEQIDMAYEKEVLENFDSQEGRLSVNEKNQAAVEKRNQAVQALLEKAQNDPAFKQKQAAQMETEIKKQNEQTLSQIMQSEEMRQWPSSAKKEYEKQARAILDDMAKQLAQAAVNAKDQKSYEQDAQRIQQAAQQKLQNIQVSVPQPQPAQ